MDKPSEKEKLSRKHRDSTDRARDSTKYHENRDHKHRSSNDKSSRDGITDDDDHNHRSKHRDTDDRRHRHHHRSSREYSQDHEKSFDEQDREESRELNEKSFELEKSENRERREKRERRERSYEREGSGDRVTREESMRTSSKRKDRGESEDWHDDKRPRNLEEMKEKRRLEDDKEMNGTERISRREKRRFEDGQPKDKEERKEKRLLEDKVKTEEMGVGNERKQVVHSYNAVRNGAEYDYTDSDAVRDGSKANAPASEQTRSLVSRILPDAHFPPSDSSHTKVSSISTTNEKKEVIINRSHEVPGKSSTDGKASDAGKGGGLSLDALAKAKRALQMQKELSEKLKKISSLNKGASQATDGSPQAESREGIKPSSFSAGILLTPDSTLVVTAASSAGATTLPASATTSVKPPVGDVPQIAGLTAQKYEAVKRAQELAARMGFRQDPEFAPLINMFPGQVPPEVAIQPKPSKAPVLRLDALGREIDEHGNLVNMPRLNSLSTLKVNINKQKKDAFQILKPELEVDPEENPHFDERMGINKDKLLRPKKMTFQFVEEGKWSRDAEIIKLKSQFGEAQAKELKAKQAQLAKAKAGPDINPNLIEVSERVITKEKPKEPIPEVEWWDVPFLRSAGTYDDVSDGTIEEDKLKMEKITIYVEHPRPIEPPAESAPPPPQPLKLTKKEQKKLRTQRRLAREKERQEMIRQGLIEPPKPKVKMSNLMKVLGSEATQDPTKLEMEIRSAAAEREQAHIDRNIARKLTPAERRDKKERKLFDDPNTLETIVSIYKINDLSHPQTRFKVDVNAQENRLTGCAVLAESFCVVVVEGGSKSIKRYGKLMLKRIKWAEAVKNDEEVDEDMEKPINKCVIVWQGSVARPSFNRFFVHECRTEAAARKVFSDAGVPHYWDLALNFTEDQL